VGRKFVILFVFLVVDSSFGGVAHAHSLAKAHNHKTRAVVDPAGRMSRILNVGRDLAGSLKRQSEFQLKHSKLGRHFMQALEERPSGKGDDDSAGQGDDDSNEVGDSNEVSSTVSSIGADLTVQGEDDELKAEKHFASALKAGTPLKLFFEKYVKLAQDEEKDTNRKMWRFIFQVVGVISFFGVIAWFVQKSNDHLREEPLTPFKFSSGTINWLSVFVGMVSGFVFGFIDNFGLFFGMDYLDPKIKELPSGSENLVAAGYGNTFSDMIGAFMGTFVGRIIEELAKKSDPNLGDYPIWTEAIGITAGCLFGVWIPRKMKGDPDDILWDETKEKLMELGIKTEAEIELIAKEFQELDEKFGSKPGMVPIGDLLEATSPDVNDAIRDADVDGNGWVQRGEVLFSYLKAAVQKNREDARELLKKEDDM
jgi:hypothetical protein